MKQTLPLILILLITVIQANEQTILKSGDYQLETLRINGERPGKTLLIFGGIHGDEPGGHLSAELLRHIHLEKGQLIIVPRVNFPSIMLNRREINGDMNRKFTDLQNPADPEQPVIDKLKELMAQADIFVNQHDAYGFHRERAISELYNPQKYGQSLIVDTGSLDSPRHQQVLDLERIGRQIVENVNAKIVSPEHHFCFWNHNSLKADTEFIEMKRSATHYAAARYQIPAFGLETSKDLPSLEHKIRYQLLVIQEIMQIFGFEYHLENVEIPKPVLYWVECRTGEGETLRVNDNTIIRLNRGERITVQTVAANYESGMSADILGWGGLNDIGREYTFDNPRTAFIRKNHMHIGRILFRAPQASTLRRLSYLHNGQEKDIPNWGVIYARKGDIIRIQSPSKLQALHWKLNLTAPEQASSSFLLPKDPGLIDVGALLKNHSLLGQGRIFDVRVYCRSELLGGFQIELEPGEDSASTPSIAGQST